MLFILLIIFTRKKQLFNLKFIGTYIYYPGLERMNLVCLIWVCIASMGSVQFRAPNRKHNHIRDEFIVISTTYKYL